MRERARGSAFDRVGQARSAALRNHDALRASRERRAHDRAEIVRVLDAVEKHEQALPGFYAEQILKLDGGLCGAKRGDPLVFARPGEAIELQAILEAQRHAARFRETHDSFNPLAVASARDQNAIEGAPCGKCFFDCVKSRDPIHEFSLCLRVSVAN
jgi:hypothetical protein